MIALIVNADDLGINAQRDRGILQAFREGLVTSSSLLANGSSFGAAARQARAVGLPVGVHLNLTDGRTLTGPIAGWTDPQGNLPGKLRLRQQGAFDNCDHAAVRRELAAQIEQILACGMQPDHLDGHQHCQIYPPLTAMIIELASEYGIRALRTTLPAEKDAAAVPANLAAEMNLYRRLGPAAHARLAAAGIRTPRGLCGLPLLHSLDTASLCRLLEGLGEGWWELMTHPGYPDPQGRAFEGMQRQVELHALLSAEARAVVTRRRIRLGTFAELPCAS